MKIFISIACVALLVGCATNENLVKRDRNEATRILDSAKLNGTLTCKNKSSCEKAFNLAKIYVQENADMKTQFSDDTTVATYDSAEFDRVALRVTKTPGPGESATIQLFASCKRTDVEGFFIYCATRISPIYRGFKPYIESKL